MKQFLQSLLTLLVLILAGSSKGVSQTIVQIGTGTDFPSTTLYGPVYQASSSGSASSSSRSNMLFTQAELAAVGITVGATITAVQFNKVNDNNYKSPVSYGMYMANTNNATLSTATTWTNILSTHTKVFDNTAFNIPFTQGWVQWDITSFVYSGGSLEIATDCVTNSDTATGPFQWQYTNSVSTDYFIGNRSLSTQPPPETLNGTSTTFRHRPNIKIIFTAATMPVTLVSFNGINMSNEIKLNWSIANETSFSHYEVERSIDGQVYSMIAKVASYAGSTSEKQYAYADKNLPVIQIDKLYYRLKMVDMDGKHSYSEVVVLKSHMNNPSVSIYPVPFRNNLSVKIHLPEASTININVVDATGRLLVTRRHNLPEGPSLVSLDDMNELPKGAYVITIEGLKFSKSLIAQKE